MYRITVLIDVDRERAQEVVRSARDLGLFLCFGSYKVAIIEDASIAKV